MKFCRLWSYLSAVIAALRSLLFKDIYEISVCVLERLPCSCTGPDCRDSSGIRSLWISQLPWMEPIPGFCFFFRDATWPRHAWSLMTAGRPHFPFIGERAGGCSGQPCRGLTLVCVFALAPCQGKENTWSWSPVLSADIFGKGCWIQVCVWSYASPSQVKHRETQRLLHFSV